MTYNSAHSSMAELNTNFNTDYDSFLIDSPDIKPVPMLTPQSSVPPSTTTPTFPGPSFQYDLYHQQTGIPRGALASTFNINKATGLQYHENNGGFIMPTETLNMPLSDLDDLDFSRNPGDMDFDDSPIGLPTMFFPENSSGPAQFVSPNTLVTPNNTSSTPIKRIYPGMHSQQAALAKAQQAQKQEQLARQQQQRPQGQKPLPGSSPTKTQPAKDPLVEESISKVLNRMRQASAASVSEDDDGASGGMSNMPRIKKDEDEMDEDERLLASEEGKKLSSKERRQLRNKVSARAFRSRRKEYISQLEGEVATKVQEANDLRVLNQQLREENNRLTDLTRMLLSSQAFSGFLQELSQSGLPPPNLQKNIQQPKPVQAQAQSQPQPMKKDVSSNAASQQLQNQPSQIGMALIPETPVDFSVLQPSNGWMNAVPTNDYHVYAVTELPPHPTLDLESLSGKSLPNKGSSKALKQVPRLPELPPSMMTTTAVEAPEVDDSIALDQNTFALYFNPSASENHCSSEGNDPDHAEEPAELSDEESMMNLKRMCDDLDDSCVKLAEFTSHM
ncbi:putative bZIP transcription factor [Cladophialophora carrionii]|uniref:Putative bZIP transcription factor n=1 Tax=Cladophialophora carrionii TaxID=86049 RepID=A0A1C1CMU7_9EURO|nr:putative bZIP transcription factor [Cladophialophora carrionii]